MDVTRQYDFANNDELVANERTRATKVSVTGGGATFAAAPFGVNWVAGIGTPTSTAPASSNSTALNVAALFTGIVVLSPSAAAQTFTTDTAANMVAALNAISSGAQVGDVISVFLVNGGANAFTVGFGTGVSKDANVSATWPASTSKQIMFRLTNVTPGSEAAVAYF